MALWTKKETGQRQHRNRRSFVCSLERQRRVAAAVRQTTKTKLSEVYRFPPGFRIVRARSRRLWPSMKRRCRAFGVIRLRRPLRRCDLLVVGRSEDFSVAIARPSSSAWSRSSAKRAVSSPPSRKLTQYSPGSRRMVSPRAGNSAATDSKRPTRLIMEKTVSQTQSRIPRYWFQSTGGLWLPQTCSKVRAGIANPIVHPVSCSWGEPLVLLCSADGIAVPERRGKFNSVSAAGPNIGRSV